MTVRKFHSVAEMNRESVPKPLDPMNLLSAIAWSKLCLALNPRRPPPGVHKYRSAEEAWLARRAWEHTKE
jgi:hypothetical protein